MNRRPLHGGSGEAGPSVPASAFGSGINAYSMLGPILYCTLTVIHVVISFAHDESKRSWCLSQPPKSDVRCLIQMSQLFFFFFLKTGTFYAGPGTVPPSMGFFFFED